MVVMKQDQSTPTHNNKALKALVVYLLALAALTLLFGIAFGLLFPLKTFT
jgi:hypothetical protein